MTNTQQVIPTEISRYGIITAHIFLLTSYVSYLKGFNTFKYLAFLLYITTILHWYELKDNSFIKYFDMFIVIITLYYFTFIETKKFSDKYRKLWYIVSFFIVIVYIININIYNKQIINESDDVMETEDYNYFHLKYTRPHTKSRDTACLINVLVHLIFLHIIPGIICITCIIKS